MRITLIIYVSDNPTVIPVGLWPDSILAANPTWAIRPVYTIATISCSIWGIDSLDGGEDDEHNGVSFVKTSKVFVD